MKTILVADDNFDNRYIIGQMLEVNGYRIVYAKNGREAIEHSRTEQPALIFMDMSMPDVDGWSATQSLRTIPEFTDTPIIAVTGHVTPDDIRRAREVGCNDVLTKPFDYDDLLRKVRTALR